MLFKLILLCVLLCVLLISILVQAGRYSRYRSQKRKSVNWPTAQATIRKGEANFRESFLSLSAGRIPKSLFGYSYEVSGDRHIGWFTIACGPGLESQVLQDMLDGKIVTVRYDPDHPQMSFVVDRDVLGQEVHQGPEWLPPSLDARS